MPDEATGSWLVFNGEIYNFGSLRRELEARQHRFRSTGDTEVLLRALLEWGPEVMRRLRGMYAFAFWDGRTKQLLLARDPFGIKPLLIAHQGDSIVFASELRSLKASGALSLVPSPMAVRSHLTFGSVIEPATIVENVVAIPPGHIVMADSQGHLAPPRRVVGLEDKFAQRPVNDRVPYRGAVDALRTQLQRSVREQLVSDVPLGIFLSGGIDSSLVASLAVGAGLTEDLTYLTISFPEPEFSELEYAQQVAKRLPGKHQTVRLDIEQMLALLPKAIAAMDQPTVDGINTFIMSSVAAQLGIKVVLSGLGGDEVFAGYTTFWKAPLLARHPQLFSSAARILPRALFGSEAERSKVVQAAQCFDVRDTYLLQRSIRWSQNTARIKFINTLPDNALVTPEAWELMSTDHRESDYKRISYLESVFYMRNQLLRDSDIFSSANSIEMRVPFLDLEVLSLAWSLPASYHRSLRTGGKRILKDILDQLHPGLPLNRRKMGFVFPWEHWLRNPKFAEMIDDTVNTPGLYQGLGVEPAEGREILKAFAEHDPLVNWSHVWSLFVLLNWAERFRSGVGAT
jgi:asparagine synthase (glutamine-hydrolysing)